MAAAYDRFIEGRAAPIRDTDLQPQELAILRYVSHGLNQHETADAMLYSYETVKTYSARIRVKLAAKTTAHAVAIALRAHLID